MCVLSRLDISISSMMCIFACKRWMAALSVWFSAMETQYKTFGLKFEIKAFQTWSVGSFHFQSVTPSPLFDWFNIWLVTAQRGPKSKQTAMLWVVCVWANDVETTPHFGNELITSPRETRAGALGVYELCVYACVCLGRRDLFPLNEFIYSRKISIVSSADVVCLSYSFKDVFALISHCCTSPDVKWIVNIGSYSSYYQQILDSTTTLLLFEISCVVYYLPSKSWIYV